MGFTTLARAVPLLWLIVASDGKSATQLSYPDALRLATEKSQAVAAALNQTEQAALQASLGAYDNDPTLALQASGGVRYREPGATRTDTDPYTRDQTYGVRLSLPVYDFGRQAAKQQQLGLEKDLATVAVASTREELTYEVGRGFLSAVAAKEIQAVTADQVRVVKAKVGEQQRSYRQGLRPESDVVSAEVDLGTTTLAYERSVSATEQAVLRLVALLGTDTPPADIELAGMPSLAQLAPSTVQGVAKGWPAQESTIDRRLALQNEALSAQLGGIKADQRPTLSAVVLVQEAGTLSPLRANASGELQLSWDLPWNGMHRDQEALVQTKRMNIDIARETSRRDRSARTNTALSGLATVVRQWSALQSQLQLVQKQQRLIQARYASGKASALELSAADGNLLSVRLDQIKLSQQAVAAAIDVAEAKGVTDLSSLFALNAGEGGELK